ncbi:MULTISPECIES: hypothetical protein [Acetobacter]|uniref:DUF1150 domain-containing protein n=1 Tax=Acetobacter thailandicus TaxID=1502842 RepID=A0ABT3QBN1_9PROT|nr:MULTISPECIES: hypothetical protein [Acetobacter]MCX2562702.1 hypothetical protein [Acetobacter thailandicus]OUI89586.1 hypothetical protein HK11_09620 [Acetobacter sp. DmW_043]
MKVTTHNGKIVLAPDQQAMLLNTQDLSEHQFLIMGLTNVAYVRPSVTADGHAAWAIHAADGALLSVVDDIEAASRIISKNDMVTAGLQ